MTDDDAMLRAVIASNRDAERAAIEEAKQFFTWTEADIAKALDPNNREVRRLTSAPAQNPEVERLAGLLGDLLDK
ncbi:hypothetical protein KZC51_06000 [Microbacterium sp. SSW1-49]|uniref:Uncharacterized protein n=1 Tax=Microbacterium croceum TaxID=2851645 RepID=A0ABT0FDB3_9MICO|nr:hypothetical protein [Microbacterium croceum]MCK2035684.1 hypothetical protein [Microbacterium croceum]